MNHDNITRMYEEATEPERHQFLAGVQRVIKLMPESLRLRRKASLIPEEENEDEQKTIRSTRRTTGYDG